MDSKRIWVDKDYDIGYKSKSQMAEFSPNPDGRNKGDTSFIKYDKRLKNIQSDSMSYRIEINQQRNNVSFPTFLDQEQFDEIKIESELEEENLSTFLINYDMKISFEENIQKFEIKEVKHFFPKIINKNNLPYIELEELSVYLEVDIDKLLFIFYKYNKDVLGVSIRKGRYMLIYKKRKKSLISIHYIVMFAIEIKKGLWKKWNQRVLVEKLSLLLFELNKIDINIDDRKLIDEWSNNYFQSKLLGI